MTEERFMQILNPLLQDPDLMVKVNEAPDWESGFQAAADVIEGLTLDEWNMAMGLIRQAVTGNAEN
ncbi:MAG: hypothetical protein ACOYB8_06585 [Eubacteriaceae bacterium]|jgi:hypothetical protein